MHPSESRRPRVSIILPCRNEAQHIERCLDSILRQQLPEGEVEVVVADGMSTDGTRDVLKKMEDGRWRMGREETTGQQDDGTTGQQDHETTGLQDYGTPVSGPVVLPSCGPVVRVIDNPGRIVSCGLNAAIRVARGEIIVRMDAHTEYAPDYLQQCVAALEKTGADNVGGPARTRAESYLERANAAAYHSPFAVGGARFHDVDYEGWVDTVTYGCWRRETFEKFGYFDEELVRNQDDEHNLRIIRGGGKIYQSPNIRSWYRPRGSLTALFKQYLQYGYWKVRVIQKHELPASWRHLVPVCFVLALLVFFLASLPFPLSVFHEFTSWCLGMILAAYGGAMLLASVHTAWKTEWKLLPVLPMVFYCYHFGYGYGFVRGIWDFIIRRRSGAKPLQQLTR